MDGPREGTEAALGASPDVSGTTFRLFSAHATSVELCLFDSLGQTETARVPLSDGVGGVWSTRVDGVGRGRLYGYRVGGPYEPGAGHRFNANKLLLDPYARAVHGAVRWDDAVYGFDRASSDGDLSFNERDSAPFCPLAIVTDERFDWDGDHPPRRPWSETVIYEAHAKGLTRLHPEVPEEIRGTYEALGHPAIVDHLKRLGVTALELLPIQAFADDRFLVERGLVNYWGYSPLAFFAPEPRYLGPGGAAGLKSAIAALHRAGIEVILDVVYNHTAEAEETGPTLSFRGIDNLTYYKPRPGDPRRTLNPTGCGNALDASRPAVARLILDSLRHWVREYRVDGFRFDLATTLARDPDAFDPDCAFLRALAADPALAGVKLIAEPWDLGENGYQAGRFPPGWSDWNDRFRDGLRGFWRGDAGTVPGLARAVSGSQEVFGPGGRGPAASINYVCSHDGFTIADLVTYTERRNRPNGEENRDGHGHELAVNHGVEGPTDDPAIVGARRRHVRNLLATLMLSVGVPMIAMGDEAGRTQNGNNNPYCQDNETTWLDWSNLPDPELVPFVAALTAIRRALLHARRTEFLTGVRDPSTGWKDVSWLRPDGQEMTDADWADVARRVLGIEADGGPDESRVLLVLNAGTDPVPFQFPAWLDGLRWTPILSTASPTGEPDTAICEGGTFDVAARSLVLFRGDKQAG